jgi:CRP/FNR family transcriptional regulator
MLTSDQSRLAAFDSIDADDLEGFRLLTGPQRAHPRGSFLRHEGSPAPEIYRLRAGWLVASVGNSDGGRQICKVHLPGDLVTSSIGCPEAVETIQALTDVTVEVIPIEVFGRIFRERPRFGALLFLWSQEERVDLMHRLSAVGRSDGSRRMGAFLLSLYRRLMMGRDDEIRSFGLPMTQQDLGDATGMSVVHANRSLKHLRALGLVTLRDGIMTLHDVDALVQFCGTPPLQVRRTDWR